MYKYFLGFRFLLFRPINLLGVGGVALAVWALITIVAIFSGFIREARSHIRGSSSDLILDGVRPNLISPLCHYPEVEKIIKGNPHVVACSPRIVLPSLLLPGERNKSFTATSQWADLGFVVLLGIEPKQEQEATDFRKFLGNVGPLNRVHDRDRPFLLPKEMLTGTGRQMPGLLVSTRKQVTRGERLGMATVNLFTGEFGDVFANPDETEENPFLVKQDMHVSGLYESKFNQHNQTYVYTHIDTARTMLGFDPLDPGYLEVFNEIAIKLDDDQNADKVIGDLQDRLIDLGLPKPWRIQSWQDRKRSLLAAVDNERGLMKLVLCIILGVALFLILATLSMMVTEKTRDIGILTALGATRTGILFIFLFCGFVISFLGALFGSVAGWLSCLYLNDFNLFLSERFGLELFPRQIYNLSEIPTQLDPLWMFYVFCGAIAAALVFSFFPAIRAARFQPVKALRYE